MTAHESPSTSPTLLELLGLPGNDEAWDTFVRLYGPLIEERGRAAGLQEADVQEIKSRVLTALVSAMRGFRYDPARRFRGYLQTVVAHAIGRHWRDRCRRPGDHAAGGDDAQVTLRQIAEPDSVDSLAGEIDADLQRRFELARHVTAEIRARLEPGTWEAFARTALQGQAAPDVAATLGKTVESVYMARYRVGQMLRAGGRRVTGNCDANGAAGH